LQIIDQNEDRPRGTYEFPFEFHHIDRNHPKYVMSYHWQCGIWNYPDSFRRIYRHFRRKKVSKQYRV